MTMNVRHKKGKWKGCGEKATFIFCWWKYQLVQAQWKREVPKQTNKQKKKNTHTAELQYDSEMLILGIYQKDFASRSKERFVLPHSLQLFTIAKT